MEIHNIESFLHYFEGVRERTLRVVGLVPEEKLEWRHTTGVFSPGDLARHIAATERYTFAENVLGRPNRYPGCGTELAEGRDAIVAFMNRMHAETIDLLHGMKPEEPGAQGCKSRGPSCYLLEALASHGRARSTSSR
jgi:hypothetical protein